jgi:Phosphoenolpyruvate phosphomutase
VSDALRRAQAYLEAGVDCAYPITLWETDALRHFISEVGGPVNVVRVPQAPSVAELERRDGRRFGILDMQPGCHDNVSPTGRGHHDPLAALWGPVPAAAR